MKKFWLNLCVFAMILIMSAGCTATAFAYSEDEVIYVTEQYLSSWVSTDFQQYLDAGITDETAVEQFTGWQNLKNNMGDIEAVSEFNITETDEYVAVTETLVCTNDTILFTITFDREILETVDVYSAVMEISAVSANASDEGEASLAKAALNTVMSMVIVFAVLIFIAVIIYLLRFIPAILDKITGKKNKASKEEAVTVAEQTTVITGVSNDEEIAAVITAAIMAYEAETGSAPGTFVVRSIRRRQK